MTQQEITSIIETYYSDKIQMATLNPKDINFLLFKPLESGLKEFKGYSVSLENIQFNTEQDVRVIIDEVLTQNQTWYNS